MMKRRGKVSPTKAAKLLGVHVNTVYSWCRSAVDGAPSKLQNVEKSRINGYFYVDLAEVQKLKDEPCGEE